jgi:PAS domain S-box-containing protein
MAPPSKDDDPALLMRTLKRERAARQRAEGLLEDRSRELYVAQQSQQRHLSYLEMLIASIADAFFLHDDAGRMIDVNPRACEALGYERDELLSMHVSEFEAGLTPDEMAQQWQSIQADETATLRGRHRRADGSSFPVEIRLRAVATESGKQFIALARDISERESLQLQLVRSEKLASIGQLSAGVAHEINNPVGYVLSNLSTLSEYVEALMPLLTALRDLPESPPMELWRKLKDYASTPDWQHLLEDLRPLVEETTEGAERVRDIVRGLRDFARHDRPEPVTFDVNAALKSTIRIARPAIANRAVVETQLGAISPVRGQPGQINQVFMNLIVNAAQSLDEPGSVTVKSSQHGNEVVVSVNDTGTGIPPDVRPHLFEPFYTTKPTGEGSGLGLSISRDIITEHGGTITVETELGEGSTFSVRLPAVIAAPATQS